MAPSASGLDLAWPLLGAGRVWLVDGEGKWIGREGLERTLDEVYREVM